MKKQEQINALQVRIERIEAHLAEQHKGNNFGKLADAVSESVPGDWATAPDWAKYKAMDANGIWNWFSNRPYIEDGIHEWIRENREYKYKLIPNHPATGKDWTETLEARPGVKETAPYMDAFESAKAESRHKADVMNAYIQAWLDYNNLPYGMDYLHELAKVVIKAEQYYRRIYAL
jgi:hypothetical protein